MRSTPISLLALLLVVGLMSFTGPAGCTADSEAESETPDFSGQLAANRAKWEASRPHRYAYTLERDCFCLPETMGPFLVVAEGDSVVSAVRVEHSPFDETPDTVDVEVELHTLSIPEAFADAANLLGRTFPQKTAFFDSSYGFPAQVAIDPPGIADGAYTLTIRDFIPLDHE